MAGFGKADTGLIQATAGAEAGQHMDSNLALGAGIGAGISAIVENYQTQQAANRKKIGELNKAFNESYKMPPGALDTQMEDLLREKMQGFKQTFLNNQEGGFEAQRALAKNKRDFDETVLLFKDSQDVVNSNIESTYVSAGMDSDDQVLASKLKNRDYLPGMRPNAAGSGNEMYYAIPINDAKPPVFDDADAKRINDIEAKPVMTRTRAELDELQGLKANKTKHDAELKEWNDRNDLEDKTTIDGVTTYNPDKYTLVNIEEAARYGSVDESRNNMLGFVIKTTENSSTNADFNDVVEGQETTIANELKNRLVKDGDKDGLGKIDTRTELNDLLFSDGTPNDNIPVNIAFKEDGTQDWDNPEEVENTYANMFIYELANPEKHSYMYNDDNGNPIEFKIEEGQPNLVYGSDEWKALPRKQRQTLLEMKLRGKDTLGVEKGAGFDPHQITQYSKFMGIVLTDRRKAQKRAHYEKSELYFDDGVNDPYAIANNGSLGSVEKRANQVYFHKEETYTNSIIDMAFGNDDSKTFSFNTDSKKGMEKIEQILKEEFKTVGMDVEVKSPGRSISIDGKEFDFSDPETRVQMLNDLKQHIVDLRKEKRVDPDKKLGAEFEEGFLGNVGNSVEDWKEDFKTKRDKHYPPSIASTGDLSPTIVNEGENNTGGGGDLAQQQRAQATNTQATNTQATNTGGGGDLAQQQRAQATNTGTQATTGGVTATPLATSNWRSNEKVQAFRVDQFNIKGSSGAGTADIFKNNEAINVKVAGGMATVKGVRADGDKLVVDIEAPFNMGGEKTMGEFAEVDGPKGFAYEFKPNKEIYDELKGEDKKDFDAFVLAIETDPQFATEIMKSVRGETDFNPADYK
jgi:hypothetical protein